MVGGGGKQVFFLSGFSMIYGVYMVIVFGCDLLLVF